MIDPAMMKPNKGASSNKVMEALPLPPLPACEHP
jgi:hypothetical protein